VRRDIVTQLSLWRRSAVARPASRAVSTARAKSNTAVSQSAGPVASRIWLGILLTAVIAFVAGAPLVALLQGSDPVSCLLWFLLYGGMALAWALWPERRQPLPKPRVSNFPCAEAYQSRWGTEERHEPGSSMRQTEGRATPMAHEAESAPAASVPLFVAYEPIGGDPNVLEARPATVCDVLMNEMERAEAAGLGREDVIEHMATVLRGARPAGRGKQPAGCGAGGGQRGGAEGSVIEAKAEQGRLPRRG
jgi:hypothetical protein